MHADRLRGLYAITPDCIDDDCLFSVVLAALQGGCHLLQYRDKLSDMPQRVARARRLRQLTREFDATFIINDDLALAALIDADGVHLGQEDGNLAAARAILGPNKILGASCYARLAAAQEAVHKGVDYLAFGAVFPSPTKPHAPTATVDLLQQAKSQFHLPICAIGGITLDNAPLIRAAGVDMLAVITDLFSASDITARAQAFQRLF